MNDKECPAEPAAGDDGPARGGFAEAAKHLNRFHPTRQRPISRQLVHKWWLYRHWNDFPEAVDVTGTANGGKGRPVFEMRDVKDWYVSYLRHRGVHNSASRGQTQRVTSTKTSPNDGDTLAA